MLDGNDVNKLIVVSVNLLGIEGILPIGTKLKYISL
jgi:hypothetical protein